MSVGDADPPCRCAVQGTTSLSSAASPSWSLPTAMRLQGWCRSATRPLRGLAGTADLIGRRYNAVVAEAIAYHEEPPPLREVVLREDGMRKTTGQTP